MTDGVDAVLVDSVGDEPNDGLVAAKDTKGGVPRRRYIGCDVHDRLQHGVEVQLTTERLTRACQLSQDLVVRNRGHRCSRYRRWLQARCWGCVPVAAQPPRDLAE